MAWLQTISDFSAADQQLIRDISQQIGLRDTPIGVNESGQIIGQSGSPIDVSLQDFEKMLVDARQGAMPSQQTTVSSPAPAPATTTVPATISTGNAPVTGQEGWQQTMSDFSRADQRHITNIANQLGLDGAPIGVKMGQVIGADGKPLNISLKEFENRLLDARAGVAPSYQQNLGYTPQIGLGGAESALRSGTRDAMEILQMVDPRQNQYNINAPTLGAAPTIDSSGVLNQLYSQDYSKNGATAPTLGAAPTIGQQSINMAGATGAIAPILDRSGLWDTTGQAAQMQQAALSGLLGKQAQADAFAKFKESPGQQYALEQAEQAILRNRAATGGLAGGNVLKELQRNAIGQAQQEFQQYQQNLAQQTQAGLQGLGIGAGLVGQQADLLGRGTLTQAQLGQQANIAQAELGQQRDLTQAQMQLQAAMQQAGLGQQRDITGANLGMQAALAQAELGQQRDLTQAQMQLQAAMQQAGLTSQADLTAANLGMRGAELAYGLGGDLAKYRYGAMERIADQYANDYQALANFAQQQGAGMAELSDPSAAVDLVAGVTDALASLPVETQQVLMDIMRLESGGAVYDYAGGTARAEGDYKSMQQIATGLKDLFSQLGGMELSTGAQLASVL